MTKTQKSQKGKRRKTKRGAKQRNATPEEEHYVVECLGQKTFSFVKDLETYDRDGAGLEEAWFVHYVGGKKVADKKFRLIELSGRDIRRLLDCQHEFGLRFNIYVKESRNSQIVSKVTVTKTCDPKALNRDWVFEHKNRRCSI